MAKPDFIASEVIPIIQRENGITIESWEVCYLLNDELAALAGAPLDRGVFYYGDVVLQGMEPFKGFVSLQNAGTLSGDNDTLYTNNSIESITPKNIFRNVLWNSVANWLDVHGHFYGIKFNRARGWVEQVANLTPGAGWTNAGTSYTHVSGTTEQIYLGAWTVSSTLRVTITFTGITTGSVALQMDNSGTFATITANGTYTFEVTTNGSDGALFIVPSNTFNGTYDNATFIVEKLDYI